MNSSSSSYERTNSSRSAFQTNPVNIISGRTSSSYRSNIAPRSTAIQRTITGPNMMTRISHTYSSSGGAAGGMHQFASGAVGAAGPFGMSGLGKFGATGIPMRPNGGFGGNALVAVNETRLREKHQLSQLNDKFAQYVEKIRFLEAQNKRLDLELNALKSREGQSGTKIREMYDIEMQEAKKLIDATNRDKSAAEQDLRNARTKEEQLRTQHEQTKNTQTDAKQRIEMLQNEIAQNEAQINLMRRRYEDLEEEAARYKMEIQRIVSEVNKITNEIYNEKIMTGYFEAEKIALEDEINHLKNMHELEVRELRDRSLIDGGLEPSQFFRNELAEAINQIRQEYEESTEQQRNDLHNRYMMQYNMMIMQHRRPEIRPVQTEQQRVQHERLQTTLIKTSKEVEHLQSRNRDLKNKIDELQVELKFWQDEDERKKHTNDQHLKELQDELDNLKTEYEKVIGMKMTLQEEIDQYKLLLEGSSNQEGLRQIAEHVEEEALRLEAEKMSIPFMSTPKASDRTRGSSGISSMSYQSVSYSSAGPGSSGYNTLSFPSTGYRSIGDRIGSAAATTGSVASRSGNFSSGITSASSSVGGSHLSSSDMFRTMGGGIGGGMSSGLGSGGMGSGLGAGGMSGSGMSSAMSSGMSGGMGLGTGMSGGSSGMGGGISGGSSSSYTSYRSNTTGGNY